MLAFAAFGAIQVFMLKRNGKDIIHFAVNELLRGVISTQYKPDNEKESELREAISKLPAEVGEQLESVVARLPDPTTLKVAYKLDAFPRKWSRDWLCKPNNNKQCDQHQCAAWCAVEGRAFCSALNLEFTNVKVDENGKVIEVL